MTRPAESFVEITPEVLLKAYACGIFPMAESADDPSLYWIEPEHRGVVPLDVVHIVAPFGVNWGNKRYLPISC